jgi:hypothetical protein
MTREDDPNRLVTVHVGPAWEVDLRAMVLTEAGIDIFTPDRMTKAMDPFITGANPLDSRLQVRAADAERAVKVFEEARERLEAQPVFDDADAGEDEDGDDDPVDDVEWLASRTRWAALIGFGLPFALFSGWLYLRACREHGRRSQAHGLTLAAFALSVVAIGSLVTWLVLWEVVPTLVG